MVACVATATTIGLEPVLITAEIDATRGKPALIIIGLATKAVDEAKERITTALTNCGIRIRAKRTVVNLAPADLPKTGSAFELAIAIGFLQLYEETKLDLTKTICFGEIALDGSIRGIKGALPLVLAARSMGFEHVLLPKANEKEVQVITGINIHPVKHLQQIIRCADIQQLSKTPHVPISAHQGGDVQSSQAITFAAVKGQTVAKRALHIAACGGHNVLLMGPPGAGKSLLAQALKSILPPLSESEAIEVSTIYSISGLTDKGLITTRPYRSPHHTTSDVGLIGGGSSLKPGEISLAHRGVLFMDEFPEFSRQSLEALRQPLETGTVTIARATGSAQYPAQFCLVAAANPCPCGYAGTGQKPCTCSQQTRTKYQSRLSGPILDRIDLHVFVKAVPVNELTHTQVIDPQLQNNLVTSVQAVREVQHRRFANSQQYITNSQVHSKDVISLFDLEPSALELLDVSVDRWKLSARSYFKLLRVARTIADIESCPSVQSQHVQEALHFRPQTPT